jgi:hypothetical protein
MGISIFKDPQVLVKFSYKGERERGKEGKKKDKDRGRRKGAVRACACVSVSVSVCVSDMTHETMLLQVWASMVFPNSL